MAQRQWPNYYDRYYAALDRLEGSLNRINGSSNPIERNSNPIEGNSNPIERNLNLIEGNSPAKLRQIQQRRVEMQQLSELYKDNPEKFKNVLESWSCLKNPSIPVLPEPHYWNDDAWVFRHVAEKPPPPSRHDAFVAYTYYSKGDLGWIGCVCTRGPVRSKQEVINTLGFVPNIYLGLDTNEKAAKSFASHGDHCWNNQIQYDGYLAGTHDVHGNPIVAAVVATVLSVNE